MSEKENKQDEMFEEKLKEQQREMLDSSDGEESDFFCEQHSDSDEEVQIKAALFADDPESTDLPADHKSTDSDSSADAELKSIESPTDAEPESTDLPAEPESTDLPADPESTNLPAEPKSTLVPADTESIDLPPNASINTNLLSSADFEGIHDFDQLLQEGLPKALLKKIRIKYDRGELLEIGQNRKEEEWKEYLWKNHDHNWPLGDEPFEMDPEMRCPYWKRREIQRKRQEEAQRWLSVGKPSSNNAVFSNFNRPPFVANANSSPARQNNNKKKRNNKQGKWNDASSSSTAAFFGGGKQSFEPIHVNVPNKNDPQKNSWVLPMNRFGRKKTSEENNNAKKAEEKWKKAKEAAEMDWTDSECEDEIDDEEDEETSTEEEQKEMWASATNVFKIGQKNGKKPATDQKKKGGEKVALAAQEEKGLLQQSQPDKNGANAGEHSGEQSAASYFPFTSPPPVQASWILSQRLVQSYMAGVNKLIRELSLSAGNTK